MAQDTWTIAGQTFTSRLMVGTGKYSSIEVAKQAIEASGADAITVAVRRIDLSKPNAPTLMHSIDPKRYTVIPNSAGCRTPQEALRVFRLAREIGGWNLVKLEVIKDKVNLLPDMPDTVEAAKLLIKEGFDVMVYCTDELEYIQPLADAGCAAIMPMGAPIGTGAGILHPERIKHIVATVDVPVLVDAGLGTASDASLAMELGCDGVLLNTAIAESKDPILMAKAMKSAVEAGYQAYCAGRMPKYDVARASSPQANYIKRSADA